MVDLDRLEALAKNIQFWSDDFFVVAGDSTKRHNPHGKLHLNDYVTWVVGPKCKSAIEANEYHDYLVALSPETIIEMIGMIRAANE